MPELLLVLLTNRPNIYHVYASRYVLNVKSVDVPMKVQDTVGGRNPDHLGCIKPGKSWDIYHINWCRIFSINSITITWSKDPRDKQMHPNLTGGTDDRNSCKQQRNPAFQKKWR